MLETPELTLNGRYLREVRPGPQVIFSSEFGAWSVGLQSLRADVKPIGLGGPPRASELTSELVDPASTTLALGTQARLESQQHVPPAIDGRPPDAVGPSPDIR